MSLSVCLILDIIVQVKQAPKQGQPRQVRRQVAIFDTQAVRQVQP